MVANGDDTYYYCIFNNNNNNDNNNHSKYKKQYYLEYRSQKNARRFAVNTHNTNNKKTGV